MSGEAWKDTRYISGPDGQPVTVWSYKPDAGEAITAGSLFSGISPGSVSYFADAIESHGHAILKSAGSDPWNHNVAGCGVGHNDAEFAESGRSMAAYYESGEACGEAWWEPGAFARRYYDPAAFTVTRDDQHCSGGMEPIPAGVLAYTDADGWVWCPLHFGQRALDESAA